MSGLRIDGRAVPTDAGDFLDQFQRIEVVDRQSGLNDRRRGCGVTAGGRGRSRRCTATRNVQPASNAIGVKCSPTRLRHRP